MSIFDKVRELFYKRPKKLASNGTRGERGQYGEDLAVDYCKRTLGFQVIARNWRHKRYELISSVWMLEFCSSSRSALERRALWLEAITRSILIKKRVLQRGSKAYINQLQNPPKHVRFDVIDVSLSDEGEGDVRHYGNVPRFSKHYTTSHEFRY